MSKRCKVLSVVGPGRSGTTILGNILGEVPGFFSAGEVRFLWQRGLIERRACGCGVPPPDCSMWSAVFRQMAAKGVAVTEGGGAAQGSVTLDAREIVGWQSEISLLRRRARVLTQFAGRTGWGAFDRYTDLMGRLYESVAEVTGARVLVDTSKRAQDAVVTARVPGIDHYVLHIVRDPRAVAYSWRRIKQPPGGRDPAMGRKRPLNSVLRWVENCLSAEALRARTEPSRWLFMRYEDFAAEPRAAVERIVAFVGENPGLVPFEDNRSLRLTVNHTVSGNSNRFVKGPVTIRADNEWQDRLSTPARLVTTAFSLPFLPRYGYAIWPHDGKTPLRSFSKSEAGD